MRNILLITFLSITLFACVEVKFKNAQPIKGKNLSEFPIELQGKYLLSMKDSINEKDTFIIGKNFFNELSLGSNSTISSNKNIFLSDSVVIKKVNSNFALSFKENEFWMIVLLKPNKEGYSAFWIDGSDEGTAEQLNLTTKVETIKDENGKVDELILNPKKKEFLKMIENKYIFTELYKLKKLK